MQWDLGLEGVGLLVAMSLGFGVIAQVIVGLRRSRWVGVAAASYYLVAGLLVSEVLFGWATEKDLQPNIDGLSFDEVLLLGLLPGIAGVLILRHVAGGRHSQT